jgi:hypothetical protein
VAEWFKAHAWKVCLGQKPNVGSNPTPSVVCKAVWLALEDGAIAGEYSSVIRTRFHWREILKFFDELLAPRVASSAVSERNVLKMTVEGTVTFVTGERREAESQAA